MRRRRIIIGTLTLGLCVVLAVMFWLEKEKPEPLFEGRKLSEWVVDIADDRASHHGPGKVAEAITAIGTDGMPFYLEWLGYKRTHLKTIELRLADISNRLLHLNWVPKEP